MIKLLIGGSPCTHWSIAQNKSRETEPDGIGWELFKNYIIAKDKFRPDFFLYENNKSAADKIKQRISEELGVPLQYINSALVSAQNRWRFYAHNAGEIPQPNDRGIMISEILESASGKAYPIGTTEGKAYCLTSNYSKGSNIKQTIGHHKRTLVAEQKQNRDGKTWEVNDSTITYNGVKYPVDLPDGLYIIRRLTVTECCRLQTLPDDYCKAEKKTHAYRGLGNGWTAEVITHIIGYMLEGVKKDEKIVVLSMYDGIGTGRYCIERLGFTNVSYYAYEIDKHAINIAMSNFKDIIQKGDAFSIRREGWTI